MIVSRRRCAVLFAISIAHHAGAPGVTAQGAPTPKTVAPRDVVREATRAHDTRTEPMWLAGFRRTQGNDPARIALAEGTLHRLAFRYDDALRAYETAARGADSDIAPYATMGRAAVLANRGDYEHATLAMDSVAMVLAARGDAAGEADARSSLAVLSLRTRGIDAARAQLAQAARLLPRTGAGTGNDAGDPALAARIACASLQLDVRGGIRIGDSTWARVLAQARNVGARWYADCGFIYAQYLSSLGRTSQAVAAFDSIAVAQNDVRAWNGLSATRQWQGSELLGRGQYFRAARLLDSALVLARLSASRNGEAWALLELGRIAARLGAPADAGRLFVQARALFDATGDRIGLNAADVARAQGQLLDGDAVAADSLLRRLMPTVDAFGPQGLVTVMAARAGAALRRGDTIASTRLIDSVEALAARRNLPAWRTDVQYLRVVDALHRADPSRARTAIDSLARLRFVGPAHFEVASRRAELYARLGALDSAWRIQASAARTFDIWRSGNPRREVTLAALQDRALDWDRDLGIATLVSQFARAGQTHRALTLAEWRRVRTLEQLALQRALVSIETQDARAVTVRAVDTLPLDADRLPRLARARLRADQAVLTYITGRGGEPTTLFVVRRDTIVTHTLASIDSLATPIRAFGAFLAAGARPAPLTQALSRAVITPALAALPSSVTQLLIVADGDLHRLPFAALDAGDGQPLVTRYAITLAPSVEDALGGVRPIAARAATATVQRALLVGAPAHMPTPADSGAPWGALPGARDELRRIASLVQHTQRLEGQDATADALRARLDAGGAVLHVATHVRADPGSFMHTALAVEPTATHDGLVTPGMFASRPLPFELVVLSACASADGVLFAGQGLHGFVSSALDAGARGVVATRWAVGDTAIVPWMQRLYTHLLTEKSALSALTMTQRDAIAAGASPAIWANLLYAGDPALEVQLTAREPSWLARVAARLRSWLGGAGRE